MTILPIFDLQGRRKAFVRYGACLVVIVAMLAAHLALAPVLGDESAYLVFFAGVVLSAWFGGLGPGVLATVVSAVLAIVQVVSENGRFSMGDYVRLGLFVAQGLLISYLLHALTTKRRLASEDARDRAERMNLELEHRVEERTAEMNATIRELEAFSYSISHDLRAPLRAIDGFSKMLQDDYQDKLDGEGKRLIDVIRHNTSNMGRLIDGLLAFSRLGRQQIGHTHLSMGDLVKDAIDEVRASALDRKIEFRVSVLPDVDGDRILLRQVLINVLSNAVKFSRDRNPAIIEIGSHQDADRNTYYIRDNGVGFDSRYANKMFGVFQRLHPATEFEGTGLGLAIVQRIVQRHGGNVWAEGAPDAGAAIYFSLPKAGMKPGKISEELSEHSA
jgi:two-component system sensor kinase